MGIRLLNIVFYLLLSGAVVTAQESIVTTNQPEAVEAMLVDEEAEKVSDVFQVRLLNRRSGTPTSQERRQTSGSISPLDSRNTFRMPTVAVPCPGKS